MNNDLISRSALIEAFRARKMTDAVPNYNRTSSETKDAISNYAQLTKGLVYAAPAVDAEPVKHGIWEEDPYAWRCSECHKWISLSDGNASMNFCTHCGARMDGRVEG